MTVKRSKKEKEMLVENGVEVVDIDEEIIDESDNLVVNIEEPINEVEEVAVNVRIDETVLETDEDNIPEEKEITKLVRIRMRESHICSIAMTRYNLEKGKLYTVPENVRDILNRAGLLAPL